jgi:protein-disulfide isomerase
MMKTRINAVSIVIMPVLLALCPGALAADASMFKPPSGAKVAIVVFEDLQCPECARASSLVWDAANAYKVPVMLHDFPLPRHNWSFEAAVWARYFDQTSLDLGNAFRKFIYANQVQVNRDNLQRWVQKFSDANKAPLPAKDPGGKLAEKVKADFALGQRIGVEHTPTIWVVSNSGASQPLVEEIKDREQLNHMIEAMLKQAEPAPPAPAKGVSPEKGAAHRKSTAKNTRKAG